MDELKLSEGTGLVDDEPVDQLVFNLSNGIPF